MSKAGFTFCFHHPLLDIEYSTPSSGGGFDECTYIPKGVANIPSMSVVPSHVWS